MINELKLKGNDLLLFALIYGFSQDEESEFKGSQNYMCTCLNCTRPTVAKSLDSLLSMELIEKRVEVISGVTFNRYKVNLQGVKKLYMGGKETLQGGGKESLHGGGKETLHNNTIIDTSILGNNGASTGSLFPDIDPNKESLFRNSVFAGDSGKLLYLNRLSEEQKLGIDVNYYYHAVADWSETKTKVFRTAKGWVATARQFMRGDKNSNKLKMVIVSDEKSNNDALDYLTNNYE